jgi:hypothetical protein
MWVFLLGADWMILIRRSDVMDLRGISFRKFGIIPIPLVDLRMGEYRGPSAQDVTDGVGLEADEIVLSYRSTLLLIATVTRQVQSGTTSDLRDPRPRHRIRSFGYLRLL